MYFCLHRMRMKILFNMAGDHLNSWLPLYLVIHAKYKKYTSSTLTDVKQLEDHEPYHALVLVYLITVLLFLFYDSELSDSK